MWKKIWAGKMAKEVKVLAAKADDLSSVPGTHTLGRENRFSYIVL